MRQSSSSTRRSGSSRITPDRKYNTQRHMERMRKDGPIPSTHSHEIRRSRKRKFEEVDEELETSNYTSDQSLFNSDLQLCEFRCKICGSFFKKSEQLKGHLLAHGNDRPFPCLTCNLRFKTKWNLMKHLKSRSHRIVQGQKMKDEKPPAGRQILPKQQKFNRSSSSATNDASNVTPSYNHNDGANGRNNQRIKPLQIEVLPFSSPIAAQFQTMQLIELGAKLRPTSFIEGALTLNLSGDRSINLPIRLRYDQFVNCLFEKPSFHNRVISTDDELKEKSSPQTNPAGGSNHPGPTSIDLNSYPSKDDPEHSSKLINRSRSQDEIQAAKTILSLAQSTDRSHNTDCGANTPTEEEAKQCITTSSPHTWDSPGGPPILHCCSTTVASPFSSPSKTLPNNATPPTLSPQTTRISDCSPVTSKAPLPISPKQNKFNRLPICPPPKKRISANFRQAITMTSNLEMPFVSSLEVIQKNKPIYCNPTTSSEPKPTRVTMIPNAITSVVTIGTSNQSPQLVPATLPNISSSTSIAVPLTANPSTAHVLPTSFALVNASTSLPNATPVTLTPNLYILPQFMLLPRVVNHPYIPVSQTPGLVAPCYVVQSDGRARMASPKCFTSTATITTTTSVCDTRFVSSTNLGQPATIQSVTMCTIPEKTNTVQDTKNESAPLHDQTTVTTDVERVPKNSIPEHGGTNSPNSDYRLATTTNTDAPLGDHANLAGNQTPIFVSSSSETDLPSTPCRPDIRPRLTAGRLLVYRNKYRCLECGLVCHKPCLLRKHYRTHSNVRPYVCRHCDVSFKTRGNLSKHMKSKGHHERCLKELRLETVPLIVDDQTQVDKQALERQRQLVLKREHIRHSNKHRGARTNLPLRIRPATQSVDITGTFANRKHRKKVKRSRDTLPTRYETSPVPDTTQPRPLETTNERIPAPNVNAVHLLQDLPLNLSVRTRQPALLLPREQNTESPLPSSDCNQEKWPQAGNLTYSHTLTDPEAVVRTAVAVAKIFHNGSGLDSGSNQEQPTSIDVSASTGRKDSSRSLPVCSTALPFSLTNRCPIQSSPQSAFKKVKQPLLLSKSLVKSNPTTKPVLLPRGTPPDPTNSDKPLDPRPYKCATCRVGFRVTGHLHKHFRARAHLIKELQAHDWSPEYIERVRASRFNVSQFINPDNGNLKLKAAEKFLAIVKPSVNKSKLIPKQGICHR